MSLTLTPAYGRDYTTAKAVKADFLACKDFIVSNFFDPADGRPTNINDLRRAGIKEVGIRYKNLTQQVFIKVK